MDRYTFSFKEKPVQLDQIFQLQKKKTKRMEKLQLCHIGAP